MNRELKTVGTKSTEYLHTIDARILNRTLATNRICFQTVDALIKEICTNISTVKRVYTCVNVQEYEDTYMPLKPRNMLSSIIVGYVTCV